MRVHAVIDTNVLVSSLITADFDSPTVYVIREIRDGGIIPIYSDYLLAEYHEVLSRSKFKIPEDVIKRIIDLFINRGVKFEPNEEFVIMPDPDDVPIFFDNDADQRIGFISCHRKYETLPSCRLCRNTKKNDGNSNN